MTTFTELKLIPNVSSINNTLILHSSSTVDVDAIGIRVFPWAVVSSRYSPHRTYTLLTSPCHHSTTDECP